MKLRTKNAFKHQKKVLFKFDYKTVRKYTIKCFYKHKFDEESDFLYFMLSFSKCLNYVSFNLLKLLLYCNRVEVTVMWADNSTNSCTFHWIIEFPIKPHKNFAE